MTTDTMPDHQWTKDLLQMTRAGLYCPAGDFYIDPWRPVDVAIVTHAHSDHARGGSRHYVAHQQSESILRMRLPSDAAFTFHDYNQPFSHGDAVVSLFPAGHMLGSAQIRIQVGDRVAVVTGDYKVEQGDSTCAPWVPVPCDLLVTESTFGMPVYRWPTQESVFDEINQWWRESAAKGLCCLLYGYAVGKSQRLLAGLDGSIGPIFTHGAVEKGCQAYRDMGIELPPTIYVADAEKMAAAGDDGDGRLRFTARRGKKQKVDWRGAMVVAVPSAHGTAWARRFGEITTGMASGWMAVRGSRRRRATDRGFILSDHIDWPGLMHAIDACDPKAVWVTHGSSAAVVRYLNETGRSAAVLETLFGGGDESEDE